MSDAQKPVDDTPAAAPAATEPAAPAEPAPAATEAAPDVTEATPAPTTTEAAPVKDETASKDDTKAEATPASEAVLGYKAPGFVKISNYRFSKKVFWFSDDAIESKNLQSYLNNEKPDVAHATAAWATQTGKGLLFFAKRAEDKPMPTGIINLAEISDITKEGFTEFFFKLGSHKYAFQASTGDERDSWMATVTTKAAEAKGMKEEIVGSEGYKSQYEKYAKPAAVSTPVTTPKTEATPKKSTEDKAKKDKAESTNSGGSSEEKKRKDKSRSLSRKRASIIFSSFLGKRDEHEEKKEVKKEEAAEDKKVTPAEQSTVEAVAAGAADDTTAAAAEDKKPAEAADKPAETKAAEPTSHKKRTSMFGLFHRKDSTTSPAADKEGAPAVPTKDTETSIVAETAPQIEAPVESGKPIEPESVTMPADTPAAPKETAAAAEESAATTETTTPAPATAPAKEKRRTSLFGSLGTLKRKEKAEKDTSDAEVTDGETKHKTTPTSPLPKLSGIFRMGSKAVKPAEKESAPAATESADKPEPISKEEPDASAPVTNGDGSKEPAGEAGPEAVNVGSTSTPVPAAA